VSYVVYNLLLTIGFALAAPFFPFIWLLGPRYRDGFAQRFACYGDTLTSGLHDCIWIHAASVGEVRAASALLRALKAEAPERSVVISTFTATGNRVARQAGLADKIIFFPLDFSWVARRAVKRIKPSLLLFLETEIWPNFVREAYRRGIPTIMLSGRLSGKALSRYKLARPLFRRVLAQYTALGMQSAEDAARIIKLGAPEKKVSVVGSLKFAVDGAVSGRQNVTRSMVPDRQVFVAGSSHRGEELVLLRALQLARAGMPRLMMVLAPRHPERFSEVEKLLRESSLSFERKTRLQPDQYFQKDVLLLDTIGELTEFFNAADVAFVGGSLVDAGGHNILEPARCQKPVLFGPYMGNFKTIAQGMKRNGGAIEVHGAEDLARVLVELLADAEARQRIGQSAADFAAAHQEALTKNLFLARQYL
jgi:3-deoxy-D-manno-octulosonic-acid transferase